MVFNFQLPPRDLLPFIKGYLEADSRKLSHAGEHMLFPNGYSGIFFNFGGIGKVVLEKEYVTPPVSIFGQIDRHFKVVHHPGFYSLGVLLKPTLLSRFLRMDMTELTNSAFDGRLARKDLQVLHVRLEEAGSTKARIDILNSYFRREFGELAQEPGIANPAIQLIHEQPNMPVRKIADYLNISERFLEKQFSQAVGLSPKTYSLIIRFKNAEKQLSDISSSRWSLLDLANDYYDQNHFIKDFKRFTGHTPSDYLIRNFEMGRSYLVR